MAPRRILVAVTVDVPDDATVSDIATDMEGRCSLRLANVTVWAPADFGLDAWEAGEQIDRPDALARAVEKVAAR